MYRAIHFRKEELRHRKGLNLDERVLPRIAFNGLSGSADFHEGCDATNYWRRDMEGNDLDKLLYTSNRRVW